MITSDRARDFELRILNLVDDSACAQAENKFDKSLELALQAQKLEKRLVAFRKDNNLPEKSNLDLKYSVNFTLALAFEAKGNYSDALATYSKIVKNKQYMQSGRLRINMVRCLL